MQRIHMRPSKCCSNQSFVHFRVRICKIYNVMLICIHDRLPNFNLSILTHSKPFRDNIDTFESTINPLKLAPDSHPQLSSFTYHSNSHANFTLEMNDKDPIHAYIINTYTVRIPRCIYYSPTLTH